jgi:hypothetical protein
VAAVGEDDGDSASWTMKRCSGVSYSGARKRMSRQALWHQGEAKTINGRGRGALERPSHGEVLVAVIWMVAGKNGGV